MEAIALLHNQLQSVSADQEAAEIELRGIENDIKSLRDSNNKIQKDLEINRIGLKEARDTLARHADELSIAESNLRLENMRYSDALLQYHLAPSCAERCFEKLVAECAQHSRSIEQLIHAASIQHIIEDYAAVPDILSRIQSSSSRLGLTRNRKKLAATKQFDCCTHYLQGTEFEKSRLTRKLRELQTEIDKSHFQDFSALDNSSGADHPSSDPPLPPSPVKKNAVLQARPVGAIHHQMVVRHSHTQTSKDGDTELQMSSNSSSTFEPWYREHRKRRRDLTDHSVEGNFQTALQIHMSEVDQTKDGEDMDIYSVMY